MKPEGLPTEEENEKETDVSAAYTDAEAWKEVMAAFMRGENPAAYSRYGYPELKKREKEVAELVGTEDVLLYNDGMAAITAVMDNLRLEPGDVILYSPSIYSQSKTYIEGLESRGVKCVPITPGDAKSVEVAIKRNNPRAIFTETVGNAKDMPVVDVESILAAADEKNTEYQEEKGFKDELIKRLSRKKAAFNLDNLSSEAMDGIAEEFEKTGREIDKKHSLMPLRKLCRLLEENGASEEDRHYTMLEAMSILNGAWLAKREKPLAVVFDNTIPTETGFDLAELIKDSKTPVTVAESGTKFFAKDAATMGLVYANNKDSIAQLEVERAVTGGYLSKNAEADLPHQTKEEFDERNKRILENTKILAEALEKIVGKAGIESVVHPNLPDHPNFQYANEKMPDGSTGVFYVFCNNAWETAKKMEEAGLAGLIEYGGSFGFEKTRFAIFGGENEKILRIAGGNESPEEFLKIIEAIEKIK